MRLLGLVLAITLAFACTGCPGLDKLVDDSAKALTHSQQIETELAEISYQVPELRQRIETVVSELHECAAELDVLYAADPRLAAVVSPTRSRVNALIDEVEEIRKQAGEVDRRLRSLQGTARQSVAMNQSVVQQAQTIRATADMVKLVGGFLGIRTGDGGGSGSGQPTGQPTAPADSGSSPWGWVLGLGAAALTSTGFVAYRKYSTKRTGGTTPTPPLPMPGYGQPPYPQQQPQSYQPPGYAPQQPPGYSPQGYQPQAGYQPAPQGYAGQTSYPPPPWQGNYGVSVQTPWFGAQAQGQPPSMSMQQPMPPASGPQRPPTPEELAAAAEAAGTHGATLSPAAVRSGSTQASSRRPPTTP